MFPLQLLDVSVEEFDDFLITLRTVHSDCFTILGAVNSGKFWILSTKFRLDVQVYLSRVTYIGFYMFHFTCYFLLFPYNATRTTLYTMSPIQGGHRLTIFRYYLVAEETTDSNADQYFSNARMLQFHGQFPMTFDFMPDIPDIFL